jgi:cytochrome c
LAVAAALGVAAPVCARNAPAPSEEARKIEALVNAAAALVRREGKAAAFAQFRTRNSKWWSGETYLFAYDQNLNVLLNPAFPKREGTNVHGQTDANGKPMHDEFLRVVREKGSGWVDYVFPRPGESKPSLKWTYVESVTFDGTPGLIGAGFYPHQPRADPAAERRRSPKTGSSLRDAEACIGKRAEPARDAVQP